MKGIKGRVWEDGKCPKREEQRVRGVRGDGNGTARKVCGKERKRRERNRAWRQGRKSEEGEKEIVRQREQRIRR